MFEHTIYSDGVAINDSTGAMTRITYLDGLTVHVNTAPTTSEYFAVTLDSGHGDAFDTVLYRVDLAAASTTDVLWTDTVKLQPGDIIKTTYANTDKRRIGVTFLLR